MPFSLHCPPLLYLCVRPAPKDGPAYNSYTNPPRPCEPVCETLVPLVIIHCKSSPLGHSAICLPHISSQPSGLSQFPRYLHIYVCVYDRGEGVFLSICTGMENQSKQSGPGERGQQLLPVMEGSEHVHGSQTKSRYNSSLLPITVLQITQQLQHWRCTNFSGLNGLFAKLCSN